LYETCLPQPICSASRLISSRRFSEINGPFRNARETVVCETFNFAAMSRKVMGGDIGMDED